MAKFVHSHKVRLANIIALEYSHYKGHKISNIKISYYVNSVTRLILRYCEKNFVESIWKVGT